MELITFSCSACQQVLKVSAENAGKQAKCPRCGAAMVIPNTSTTRGTGGANPPPRSRAPREEEFEEIEPEPRPRRSRPRPPEDEYEEDRPRRPRRREDDDDDDYDRRERPKRRAERHEEEEYEEEYERKRPAGMSTRKKWGFVRLGVLLVFIGACALCAFGGLQVISDLLFMISMMASKDIGMGAFKVIMRIGHGLALAGGITALVGYVFFIFVPNKNGTFPLAITLLALGGVNLIVNILFRLVPMFKSHPFGLDFVPIVFPGAALSDSPAGALILSILAILFLGAEFIIAPLFFMAVSRAIKSRYLGGSWIVVLIMGCVTAGLQFLNIILFYVADKNHSRGLTITWSVLQFLAAGAFLGQMIWYTLLSWRTREAIE
jgi:hypothetical protein